MMRRRALVPMALAVTVLVALPAFPPVGAQQPHAAGQPPGPDWGTDATHTLTLHAIGFVPEVYWTQWSWVVNSSGLFRFLVSGSSPDCFGHTLVLPSGSYVTGAALDGCDDNPGTDLDLVIGIRRDPRGPASGSGYPLLDWTTAAPGCQSFQFTPTSPFGIDNDDNSYIVEVCLPGGTADTSVRFKAVRISYKLQVSPAPASATFGDVPTDYWAFQHIEALVASGITAGCGGGNYCPDAPLTRAQMAVFLAKGLGLHWE